MLYSGCMGMSYMFFYMKNPLEGSFLFISAFSISEYALNRVDRSLKPWERIRLPKENVEKWASARAHLRKRKKNHWKRLKRSTEGPDESKKVEMNLFFSLILSTKSSSFSPIHSFLNLCLAADPAEDSHPHPAPLKDRAHVFTSHSS